MTDHGKRLSQPRRQAGQSIALPHLSCILLLAATRLAAAVVGDVQFQLLLLVLIIRHCMPVNASQRRSTPLPPAHHGPQALHSAAEPARMHAVKLLHQPRRPSAGGGVHAASVQAAATAMPHFVQQCTHLHPTRAWLHARPGAQAPSGPACLSAGCAGQPAGSQAVHRHGVWAGSLHFWVLRPGRRGQPCFRPAAHPPSAQLPPQWMARPQSAGHPHHLQHPCTRQHRCVVVHHRTLLRARVDAAAGNPTLSRQGSSSTGRCNYR
jgi:hypothetical protein